MSCRNSFYKFIKFVTSVELLIALILQSRRHNVGVVIERVNNKEMVHPCAIASLTPRRNSQRNFASWNFHEEPSRKPRGNISGWNFRSLIHAWIWQLKPTVTRYRLHNTRQRLALVAAKKIQTLREREREALEESANKITRVFEPESRSHLSQLSLSRWDRRSLK